MVSLALLLRPSTTPLDSCFLVQDQCAVARSVLAIFFIGPCTLQTAGTGRRRQILLTKQKGGSRPTYKPLEIERDSGAVSPS